MASVQRFGDVAAFLKVAGDYLAADPVRTTTISAQATGATAGPSDWYAVSRDESGRIVGAAMRTGDYPAYLLDVPVDAATELARLALVTGDAPTRANGSPAAAAAFLAEVATERGGDIATTMRTRLHRLATLTPPVGVPGEGRVADLGDAPILIDWCEAFEAEVGTVAGPSPREVWVEMVARRIDDGTAWVWTDEGQVTSFALGRAPAFGVSRIGPVYTPPEQRNRGYAAAVTALAAQTLLERGAQVCLFTDLANPTSNGVYQRIGFEPVGDFVNLHLVDLHVVEAAAEGGHDA